MSFKLENDFFVAIQGGYETIINPDLRHAIKHLIESIQDELDTEKQPISYKYNATNSGLNLIRLIKAFENELENKHIQTLTPLLSQLTLRPHWAKVQDWLATKPNIRKEWRLNKKRTINRHLNSQLDYERFGNWFLDTSWHLSSVPQKKEIRNSLFCLGHLLCKININILSQHKQQVTIMGEPSSESFCELCSLAIKSSKLRFCELHKGHSSDRLRREQKIKRLAYKMIPKNSQYAPLLQSRKAIDVRQWREFVWLSLERKWRTLSNLPRVALTYDEMCQWRNFIDYLELQGGKANIAAVQHLRERGLTFGRIGDILNCSRQAAKQAFHKTPVTSPPKLFTHILDTIVSHHVVAKQIGI